MIRTRNYDKLAVIGSETLHEGRRILSLNKTMYIFPSRDIICTWTQKGVTMYHNLCSGTQGFSIAEVVSDRAYLVTDKNNLKKKGIDVQYLPQMQAVMLQYYYWDSVKAPKPGEIRLPLMEYSRIYFRNTEQVFALNQRLTYMSKPNNKGHKLTYFGFPDQLISVEEMITFPQKMQKFFWCEKEDIVTAFQNLFSCPVKAGNHFSCLENIDEINRYLQARWKSSGTRNPAVPPAFPEVNIPDGKEGIFQRVSENLLTMQFFIYGLPCAYLTWKKCNEKWSFSSYCVDVEGKWSQWKISSGAPALWSEYHLNPVDEQTLKDTPLQYWRDILNRENMTALYNLLMYTHTEKLYKAGFSDCLHDYFQTGCDLQKGFCEDLGIDKSDWKNPNLDKMLGINARQKNWVTTSGWKKGNCSKSMFAMAKAILTDRQPISSIDEETSSAVFAFTDQFREYTEEKKRYAWMMEMHQSTVIEICRMLRKNYSSAKMKNAFPAILEIVRLDAAHTGCLQLYKDFLIGLETLKNAPKGKTRSLREQKILKKISPVPDKIDEETIRTMHDYVMYLCQARLGTESLKSTEETVRWNNRKTIWKQWEYQDDTYQVIIPENPGDVVFEGISLHHCSRQYVDRLKDGSTNIVFIREKSAPDVPFFTAEISNESKLEQIHGLRNRNLDTEPALIPFVKKWMKVCRIKSNRFNKTR